MIKAKLSYVQSIPRILNDLLGDGKEGKSEGASRKAGNAMPGAAWRYRARPIPCGNRSRNQSGFSRFKGSLTTSGRDSACRMEKCRRNDSDAK